MSIDKEEILRKNFVDWVYSGIKQRGWSLRELDRRSEVAASLVSNIKRGIRRVTWDTVSEIAIAFGEEPEDAFRRVGLLPRPTQEEIELSKAIHYLSDGGRRELVRYAKELQQNCKCKNK